nr:MAG TPA: hypothetical protein [Caudoviricetes sp.]
MDAGQYVVSVAARGWTRETPRGPIPVGMPCPASAGLFFCPVTSAASLEHGKQLET